MPRHLHVSEMERVQPSLPSLSSPFLPCWLQKKLVLDTGFLSVNFLSFCCDFSSPPRKKSEMDLENSQFTNFEFLKVPRYERSGTSERWVKRQSCSPGQGFSFSVCRETALTIPFPNMICVRGACAIRKLACWCAVSQQPSYCRSRLVTVIRKSLFLGDRHLWNQEWIMKKTT